MEENIAPSPTESPEKTQIEQRPSPSESPLFPPKKERKSLKIFVGILIAFAVFAAGISGYWFYQEKIVKKPVSDQKLTETPPAKILFMRENNLWIMNPDGSNQELWMEDWQSTDNYTQINYTVSPNGDYVGLQTGEKEHTIYSYPAKEKLVTLPIPHFYVNYISWPTLGYMYYRLPLENQNTNLDEHVILYVGRNKELVKIRETKDCYRLEVSPDREKFICQNENRLYLGKVSEPKNLTLLEKFSQKNEDNKYRMPPNNDFYKIRWLDSKKVVILYEAKDSPEASGLPDVPGPSYFNLAFIDTESDKIIDAPVKSRVLFDWNSWARSSKDLSFYLYLYGQNNLIVWKPSEGKINEITESPLIETGPDYYNMLRLKWIDFDFIIYSIATKNKGQPFELKAFNQETGKDSLITENAFITENFYFPGRPVVFEKREFEPDSTIIKSQNIYTINSDGTGLKQLTFDGKSYSPSWIEPVELMPQN